jgi:hypothetical protein
MRMRRRVVLLAALLLSGCAASTFDRHLAAERWTDAAHAFASDSALHSNERAMYRAALLYGTPGLDTWQPQVARELLARMLQLHPNSIHRESAIRVIALIDEVQRVNALTAVLELTRVQVETELEALRADVALLESRLSVQTEEREQLRIAVERLQGDVRSREQQLRTLREELDRLKAIDLRAGVRSGGVLNPDR